MLNAVSIGVPSREEAVGISPRARRRHAAIASFAQAGS